MHDLAPAKRSQWRVAKKKRIFNSRSFSRMFSEKRTNFQIPNYSQIIGNRILIMFWFLQFNFDFALAGAVCSLLSSSNQRLVLHNFTDLKVVGERGESAAAVKFQTHSCRRWLELVGVACWVFQSGKKDDREGGPAERVELWITRWQR